MGLYLKVECMNQSETNFSITAEFQQLWQGAISHVWTSQFDKHWQHSQKQLQKYNIRDLILPFGVDLKKIRSFSQSVLAAFDVSQCRMARQST